MNQKISIGFADAAPPLVAAAPSPRHGVDMRVLFVLLVVAGCPAAVEPEEDRPHDIGACPLTVETVQLCVNADSAVGITQEGEPAADCVLCTGHLNGLVVSSDGLKFQCVRADEDACPLGVSWVLVPRE
jgi:hypothetical protein